MSAGPGDFTRMSLSAERPIRPASTAKNTSAWMTGSITPASAGPAIWAAMNAIMSRAMALVSSLSPTRSGVSDCRAAASNGQMTPPSMTST